ncbi:immunity protein Tsi6 family protein [Simiduia aestuariiviva]|uniref:Tsi6 domain-containing protein n=1 Tax=Simiduia aestuariiviva TaxID=1510459 RepID=A0A839UQ42_9GAMM|nr:immunity protein Tsi6 family protein [Simiduia aestuariiviva]MBB3167495.1 hypothetical protein [Simiduia aestuariiviva]
MSTFNKIENAKRQIDSLLLKNPNYQLLQSIHNQLLFIIGDFDENGKILKKNKKNDVEKLILGVQAIRELDTSFPELSDLLCDIDFEYKGEYGISNLP